MTIELLIERSSVTSGHVQCRFSLLWKKLASISNQASFSFKQYGPNATGLKK